MSEIKDLAEAIELMKAANDQAHRILLECKDYASPMGVAIALVIRSRINDIPYDDIHQMLDEASHLIRMLENDKGTLKDQMDQENELEQKG